MVNDKSQSITLNSLMGGCEFIVNYSVTINPEERIIIDYNLFRKADLPKMEELQESQCASGSTMCTSESFKETRNEETNRSLQIEKNSGSNESHDRELPQLIRFDLLFGSPPMLERGDNEITSPCVPEYELHTQSGSDNVFEDSSDEIDSFPMDERETGQGIEYSAGKSTNTNQENSLQKFQELPTRQQSNETEGDDIIDEIDSFPIDQTEASQGMEYSAGKSTNTNQENSLQKFQELPIRQQSTETEGDDIINEILSNIDCPGDAEFSTDSVHKINYSDIAPILNLSMSSYMARIVEQGSSLSEANYRNENNRPLGQSLMEQRKYENNSVDIFTVSQNNPTQSTVFCQSNDAITVTSYTTSWKPNDEASIRSIATARKSIDRGSIISKISGTISPTSTNTLISTILSQNINDSPSRKSSIDTISEVPQQISFHKTNITPIKFISQSGPSTSYQVSKDRTSFNSYLFDRNSMTSVDAWIGMFANQGMLSPSSESASTMSETLANMVSRGEIPEPQILRRQQMRRLAEAEANAIAEEEENRNEESRIAFLQNDETEEEVNNCLFTKKCCVIL